MERAIDSAGKWSTSQSAAQNNFWKMFAASLLETAQTMLLSDRSRNEPIRAKRETLPAHISPDIPIVLFILSLHSSG